MIWRDWCYRKEKRSISFTVFCRKRRKRSADKWLQWVFFLDYVLFSPAYKMPCAQFVVEISPQLLKCLRHGMNGRSMTKCAGRKLSVISFHLLLPWGSSELLINGVKHVSLPPWCWILSLWWRRDGQGPGEPTVPSWSFWCCMLMLLSGWTRKPMMWGWGAGVKELALGWGSQWAVALRWEVLVRDEEVVVCSDWVLLGGEVCCLGNVWSVF